MSSTPEEKISITEIMKRAQLMQQQLENIQQELSQTETPGVSGGGLVKVILNGQRDCRSVKIDPSLLQEDITVLEDLVVSAFNDAIKKVEKLLRDKMGALGGAGGFPGDAG